MLTKSDLVYELPEELIAQHPPENRGTCRLMVLDRKRKTIEHTVFGSLGSYLLPEDVLVLNDTRVINARLKGRRDPSGGTVELLLLEETGSCTWKVMVRPGKRCRKGSVFSFEGGLRASLEKEMGLGRAIVRFSSSGDTASMISRTGTIPIPPYIKRESTKADDKRYQTVFAKEDGAVAAPTAGLHFTEPMLDRLRKDGISVASLTLHVGPGTFQPLRNEILAENRMEEERYSVSEEALSSLRKARTRGGRIAAVGTTVTRALESIDIESRKCLQGRTDIFIHPPYRFRNVDVLLTNFHLPGSSLISLVGSFTGLDFLMEAYRTAIENEYKFYSYGDAMLII